MDRTTLSKEIGNRIKAERKRKNLSQENVAFEANIHTSYYGCIERGEKCPTIETIYKISTALGIPAAALLPEYTANNDTPANRIINAVNELPPDKQTALAGIVEKIALISK